MKTLLQYPILTALISLSYTLYSQTGPGGVGDASTNVLWLDASQLNLNNGDPVSNWPDISGNSNDAIQSNSTNQPTYLVSAINGKPGITFDGVDDYLDLTNHISSTEQSVFMINEVTGNAIHSAQLAYVSDGANLNSYYHGKCGFWYTNIFKSAGIVSFNSPFCLNVIVNHNVNTLELGTNNIFTNTTYPGFPTKSRSVVGANYSDGLSQYRNFINGKISEIIVYNTEINNAQRIIVNNYLANKYQITSSFRDIYYNSNQYFHEVCGIGQINGQSHTDSKGTGEVEIYAPTSLNDGEFLFIGHNNNDLSVVSDIPLNTSTGGRWNRVWKWQETGNIGNYSITFYLGTNGFGTDNNQYYIIADDNGVFSDGGQSLIGPGVFNSSNNTVTFSNIRLPYLYFTLMNKSYEIYSVQSGNWEDPSTWSCNCIPDSTVSVTVSSGHTVNINRNYESILNIKINSNSNLNLYSNTLSVKGDIIINGNFDASQGTIRFSGASKQKITNNSMSPRFDIYNYKQVYSNTVEQIFGNIGVLNRYSSNGRFLNSSTYQFVFYSSSTQTSFIDKISYSNPFGGNIRTVRYISSRSAAWADISSAVQADKFSTLDKELYFSGIGGNDGNATDENGVIFYSAYSFNASTQQYDTVKTTSRVLNPGEGFEIWLADNEYTYDGGKFYAFGIPNYGDISADPYLPSNAGEWALLGNPYMSWIEWSSVTKSGLPNEVWIYEASAGNYVLHNSGNVAIPPMQGFWVQVSANNPSATFTENCKIASNSSTFYKNGNGIESFALTFKEDASGYYQTCYLRKDISAFAGYDAGKDATLLPSKNKKAPVFTFVDEQANKNLMLNYINTKQHTLEIPLYVSVKMDGIKTISTENIDYIKENYNYIELIDKFNHKVYNLEDNEDIELYLTKGDYTGRFALRLSDTPSDINNTRDLVFVSSNSINIKMEKNAEETAQIIVIDVQGRVILNKQNVSQNFVRFDMPTGISSGTYFVKIIKANQVETHKLAINK